MSKSDDLQWLLNSSTELIKNYEKATPMSIYYGANTSTNNGTNIGINNGNIKQTTINIEPGAININLFPLRLSVLG